MTPKHFDHVIEQIRRYGNTRYTERLDEVRRAQERLAIDLADMTDTTQKDSAALTKATVDYMSTGLAITTPDTPHLSVQPHRYGFGHKCWSWKQYFRGLAAELKRPFVYGKQVRAYNYGRSADTPPWRDEWQLQMPNLKRCAPLYAALMLYDPTVCKQNESYTSLKRFTFTGDEGTAAFEAWRQQCLTEPDYRRVLGTL